MPRWTPEARQRQAQAIRLWTPWIRSTGPKTTAGKMRSARNALKGGVRSEISRWSAFMRSICGITSAAMKTSCRNKRSPEPRRTKNTSKGFASSLDALESMFDVFEGVLVAAG